MTALTFTILLAVHRPPALLPYAIASVLAQDQQDFELFVICDGAPPETAARAREFAASDTRIRVFEHPKGEGHGEVYRHQALQEARGKYVCHIGDDDLWLPNHLTEIAALLREFDFGNLTHVEVLPDGKANLLPGNLGNANTRQRMMTSLHNIFGPTECGYRLSAYRELTFGWTPSPPDVPSDLHTWRKFLARDDFRFGTRMVVTSVKFAAGRRGDWSLDRRLAEIAAWAQQLSKPSAHDAFVQEALRQLSQLAYDLRLQVQQLDGAAKGDAAQTEGLRASLRSSRNRAKRLSRKLRATRGTLSWRLTRPFRGLARFFAR